MHVLRALGLIAALALAPSVAMPQDLLGEADGIEISDGHAFAAGASARSGAAYFRITNTGTAPDRLVEVRSAAAQAVQLHEHEVEGGIARMRPVEGGIVVEPGATVLLKRGGLHVMMMGLTAPFEPAGVVDLTLVFERAGPVEVQLPVESTAPHGAGGHGG